MDRSAVGDAFHEDRLFASAGSDRAQGVPANVFDWGSPKGLQSPPPALPASLSKSQSGSGGARGSQAQAQPSRQPDR